jgi:glutaredoxin
MTSSFQRAFTCTLVAATFGALGVACSKNPSPSGGESAQADKGVNPAPDATPAPFELKDDTADLLLTWLDVEGDFHVVQTIAEVPEQGRSRVRVVITTKDVGTGQTVFVADLRNKDAQGRYPVVGMERAKWNELGAEKRKVRMEALAPKAPSSAEPAATGAGAGAANGKVHAVIYGASWCKPCHLAEDLLKKLGVDVVKKDIEESRAAQAEMQEKLAKAGRGGASIPVIDVAGQLFVGYEPRTLTAAVERARGSKPQ